MIPPEIYSIATLIAVGYTAYHLTSKIKSLNSQIEALNTQVRSQEAMLKSYQDFTDATSWRKVKEHYEEFKIPSEIEKAKKAFEEEVDKQIAEIEPHIDKTIDDYIEAIQFVTHICLYHLDKETAKRLVKEKMPGSAQHFEKVWAFLDTHILVHRDNQQ